MNHKAIVIFIFVTTWILTDGQFLYNYEQDQSSVPPSTDDYDPSSYKYNPPSALEHFLQSQRAPAPVIREPEPVYHRQSQRAPTPVIREPEPVYHRQSQRAPTPVIREPEPVYRRQSQQQETSHYQLPPQPEVRNTRREEVSDFDEYELEPEFVPEPPRPQRRRTTKRKKIRVRQTKPVEEDIQPPRYYGPSVFEDVGLGQAPAGVYVPHDSLLNLLRDDASQNTQSRHVDTTHYNTEPRNVAPVRTIQPVIQERPIRSPFFVEPPLPQAYSSNTQPTVRHRENQVIEDIYPELPVQETVQPPRPIYRPSSQEILQDVYRQQRRMNRNQSSQHHQSQTVHSPRRRQRPVEYVPESRVVEELPPPPPEYETRNNQVFEDDIRRSPPRRIQETPKRRQRPQVRNDVTQAPRTRQPTTFKPAQLAIAELPDDIDGDEIPGEAGHDYPTLHVIPKTSFSCAQQPHNGYYADLETSCQVVHLCHSGGVQSSFLCPNGTIFSQEKFACQWWYKVDCQSAPRYYSINDSLYKVPGETEEIKRK